MRKAVSDVWRGCARREAVCMGDIIKRGAREVDPYDLYGRKDVGTGGLLRLGHATALTAANGLSFTTVSPLRYLGDP